MRCADPQQSSVGFDCCGLSGGIEADEGDPGLGISHR